MPASLAAIDDEVLRADRRTGEEGFEDLPGSRRVSGLGREGGTRRVRRHRVVRHRPPGMVNRRRLRIPHVPGVASELARFERRATASGSMMAPRAVLTMYEPRRIDPMSSSSKSWYVSGTSGLWIDSTSTARASDWASGWKVRPELGLDLRG